MIFDPSTIADDTPREALHGHPTEHSDDEGTETLTPAQLRALLLREVPGITPERLDRTIQTLQKYLEWVYWHRTLREASPGPAACTAPAGHSAWLVSLPRLGTPTGPVHAKGHRPENR